VIEQPSLNSKETAVEIEMEIFAHCRAPENNKLMEYNSQLL